MSTYSTGVTACIFAAYWVQMQPVVSGCGFIGHRLSVLVPDEGGVVAQRAGGAAGQGHSLSLCSRYTIHPQLDILRE